MNTFGNLLKITSFGESHGKAIGVVIDGVPAGLKIDEGFIFEELTKRKPGQSKITTQRNEADEPIIVSGVFENKTIGAPITILISNNDSKTKDYKSIKDIYRPSHADFTYQKKYEIRDYRGGGRSSARITAGWVAAGAIAKLFLKNFNIEVKAYTKQVYNIVLKTPYTQLNLSVSDKNNIKCPDEKIANEMENAIEEARKNGDSLGGIISCIVENCPAGLGEPVFDKLNAQIAKAVFSINAVKAIQFGDGFNIVNFKGSQINDEFIMKNNKIRTLSNHSGGIQGGISNGETIYFETAFKPVSTIFKPQKTLKTNNETVIFKPEGRHDPCVLPRAVPIVEAMTALVIADFVLLSKTNKM
ncbi:MAG: chorismate synthase [Bacteroidetes bacterium]|nr:chorismate synthase [Bacteroidota bacterium]